MRPHRTDFTALIAGVVFVGIAAAQLAGGLDDLETHVKIVWPAALIAIGIGILLGGRRGRENHQLDR